ncbi:uncharacterized protein [Epargyreus clarus]|uniref:uncharacterized protein n=1 Tax=Epargyreus clarus TaxID=520877 RepID=UPI003C2C1540
MSSNKMRYVNIVPNVKIKKEKREDDDDVVLCKLCAKGFASTTALMNHARMEHVEEYVSGEDLCMEPPPKLTKAQQREETKQQIKRKTEELISSMSPTNLMSFASPDVSYIIIKAEGATEPEVKRRREKTRKVERNDKLLVKKEREPLPISGPFECLQPSTLVADGTCHQIFFSCCEYSAHYRDEHTRRRKGLKCQVCEKPLGLEPSRPHSCETCGMGFNTVKELADHASTAHIKYKPFACSVCNKRFTQQGGLQQHMRMHTGDRPFNCTFCPKAFTQKSGLEQHLRIHTKVRPYRCVICSKSFCQSIHLKQHMRTHTNVSPFQCALCQKRFKQSSHLNYHLKCHNPANMSPEQKQKYEELMGLIGKNEVLEVEVDQSQSDLQYEVVQNEIEEDIQEEYILGDCIVDEIA